MQISVPVTFDATNQTMSVSDSSLITFPQNTSDFSIVTVNGTACITPTTVSTARANYVTFVFANTVTEIEFDSYITIPSASWNWNLWFELKVPGPTYYSLTYEPQGNWHNPDGLSCNLATGTWYTIKVTSSTINIYNKSSGTLVHTRSLVGMPSDLSIANFIGSTSYLANLILKRTINTEAIRYANTAGIAEIWANIKNWVSAHIGNGTLTIQKNGTDVATFSANSSSNATANITVPTKVSDLTNDSGFLTTASIPSKTSDLTNDSGFITGVTWNDVTSKPSSYTPSSHTHTKSEITDFPSIPSKTSDLTNDSGFLTSHQSLSNYSTLANTVKSLSISGKTITVTPGSGSTYTLTTQDTVYTHPTTSGNKHIPSGGSSGQFLGWDSDGTAKWVNNPNTNTDTLVNQNVSTANNTYPVLIAHTANATANLGAKEAYFGSNVKINPSTGALYATKLYSNNAEVLTSHQSLSNYLTKTTNVSEMGRYIDMHYDNATSAYDYDVRLYVSAQGTAAGKGTFAVTAAATILNHKLTLLDFIYNKNSTLVKGTQPTSTLYTGIYLCDKNGTAYKNNALGLLENSVTSANLVSTYIRAIKNEANSQVACEIAARVDASGNAYTYAPTPATADNSTKIATTAFVKAQGYLTSHQSLSNYSTLANTVKSLSISGKTITVTPGSGNAYTLTTQDTVYTHPTSAGNKHIPSGGSSGQILKYSASGTAVWADVSFTRRMEVVASDAPSGTAASGNYLPRDKSTTLTSSQLAVVTIDVTTSSSLMVKLTATNIFVIAIHTLVGTNGYKQDAVNYGSILQQTAAGRSRVVALILPYASSVKFTLAVQSGSGNITSYTLSVYQ